ncbi:membrane protein [Actinocorallia aurea]
MDGFLTVLLWLVALFLLSTYVSWRAGRLDRLHARVDLARAALDGALVRRAAVALELATSQLLDPATSLVLATAAHAARTADAEGREFAESDLSRALRAVVDQPGFHDSLTAKGAGPLLEELDAAAQKASFARRFYNDAVSATRIARRRILARVVPLAGHAPMPEFFEIDDTPPALG